jgi:NADH-quinone oxidoreductase subunit M
VSLASKRFAKILTSLIAGSTLLLTIIAYTQYDSAEPGFQLVEVAEWAPGLGLSYTLGADGITLPLLMISSILTTLVSVGSFDAIKEREGLYYALLLLFEGAIIGVFTSLNLILFYVFWELVLIPMFFFIGIWGGPKKKYAAMKFLIMTHVGSTIMLLSFITFYVLSTPHTFDFRILVNLRIPLELQIPMALALFVGFGVKLPIVPLHTWLPDAHVEAPAPISVLLAGLLLKMGGYGFIRMILFLLPDASVYLSPVFMGFGILTMFYGAIVAMVQQDLKRMIALTSINHMGYVLLGAFTGNAQGLAGAVFQMFNHANAIGILFLMTGVIHERMGTRTIRDLSGMNLVMPKTSLLLILGSLGAMAFPGFSNFISEYMVILAAISVSPWLALTVIVPAVTSGYFMWMMKRTIMTAPPSRLRLNDAPGYLLVTLGAFIVPLILFGLWPAPLLGIIQSTISAI